MGMAETGYREKTDDATTAEIAAMRLAASNIAVAALQLKVGEFATYHVELSYIYDGIIFAILLALRENMGVKTLRDVKEQFTVWDEGISLRTTPTLKIPINIRRDK